MISEQDHKAKGVKRKRATEAVVAMTSTVNESQGPDATAISWSDDEYDDMLSSAQLRRRRRMIVDDDEEQEQGNGTMMKGSEIEKSLKNRLEMLLANKSNNEEEMESNEEDGESQESGSDEEDENRSDGDEYDREVRSRSVVDSDDE